MGVVRTKIFHLFILGSGCNIKLELSKSEAITLRKNFKNSNSNIRSAFVASLTFNLFKKIHTAFVLKSKGGTDDQGLRWKPLKRSTIASRPIRGRGTLALSRRSRKGRGLLTKSQQIRWNGIYSSNLTRLAQFMPIQAASAKAAMLAWGILKKEGAETRIDKLGSRKVDILVDSGKLKNSLKPGRLVADEYIPTANQIYKKSNYSLTIGTSVEYAKRVHKIRKFWPSNVSPWVRDASKDAIKHIKNL